MKLAVILALVMTAGAVLAEGFHSMAALALLVATIFGTAHYNETKTRGI